MFDVSISYKKFPSKNVFEYFKREFNVTNVMNTRKNYLITIFYFESLMILNIYESAAFTIVDMFIYIGNRIGLFMDMSFQSVLENGYVFFMIDEYGLETIIIFTNRNLNIFASLATCNRTNRNRRSAVIRLQARPNRTVRVAWRI